MLDYIVLILIIAGAISAGTTLVLANMKSKDEYIIASIVGTEVFIFAAIIISLIAYLENR